MNLDKFLCDMGISYAKRSDILKSKNKDYAVSTDVLKNFKGQAKIHEVLKVPMNEAWGVALAFALLKIDSLCNLKTNHKTANNESIQDTVDDLKNYIELMDACMKDE